MDPLDGNAIAGALYEAFGAEMTTVTGVCRRCGAARLLAEVQVYTRAPGMVARCPSCGSVLFVLVEAGETLSVNLDGIDLPPGPEAGGATRSSA